MAGIIEELQRGALDPSMPVDALLRRVQLAAVKLRLPEVESWVQSELNGYSGDLPDYRKVRGQLRAWNPYHGWLPVLIAQTDLAEMVSEAPIGQSVGTLVDLATNRPAKDEGLHFNLPPGLVNELNKIMSDPSPRYIIQLSRGNVVGILDRVRNLVLDWAIRMEQQGIVGEGISFSPKEQERAQAGMTTIHIGNIGNMAGHIGSGNDGDVRATQTANVGGQQEVASLISDLRKAIASGAVADTAMATELDDAAIGIERELKEQKPDAGRIRRLLAGLARFSTEAGAAAVGHIIAGLVLASHHFGG